MPGERHTRFTAWSVYTTNRESETVGWKPYQWFSRAGCGKEGLILKGHVGILGVMEMFFLCVCVYAYIYIFIFIYFYFLLLLHCTPCEILVSWPGIEPVPAALEGQSLNHCPSREAPKTVLSLVYSISPSTVSISQKLIKKGVLHFVN